MLASLRECLDLEAARPSFVGDVGEGRAGKGRPEGHLTVTAAVRRESNRESCRENIVDLEKR